MTMAISRRSVNGVDIDQLEGAVETISADPEVGQFTSAIHIRCFESSLPTLGTNAIVVSQTGSNQRIDPVCSDELMATSVTEHDLHDLLCGEMNMIPLGREIVPAVCARFGHVSSRTDSTETSIIAVCPWFLWRVFYRTGMKDPLPR